MQIFWVQVSQIHQQLPPGGILVFLTGQREVEALCKRLRTSLVKQPGEGPEADAAAAAAPRAENGFEGGSEGGTEAAFGEDAAENAEGDAGERGCLGLFDQVLDCPHVAAGFDLGSFSPHCQE